MIYEALTIYLFIFFIFMGCVKLFNINKYIYKKQLSFIIRYGFSAKYLKLIGLAEISAAVLLLINNIHLNILGLLLIFIISGTAVAYHYSYYNLRNAYASIFTLLIAAALLTINSNALSSLY